MAISGHKTRSVFDGTTSSMKLTLRRQHGHSIHTLNEKRAHLRAHWQN